MKTILVVDDMAVFREPIAASLRLAGYQTLCASDGQEALDQARQHRPDLILLDLSMPRMDGLTVLRELRGDPAFAKTPVILLTALSEKNHVLAAGALGVREYLLKSRFRLKDLLERIAKLETSAVTAASAAEPCPKKVEPAVRARIPASSEVPQLLTREQTLQRIDQGFAGKTLSGVVAQVLAMANSPRGDAAELAKMIVRDSVLSARILQAANSASYSTGGAPVATIPAAIKKVGFSTVRNVAAALGVFDAVPNTCGDGFNPIQCWQHSFAVAQLCEQLAATSVPEQCGLAYVIGLCHDLGQLYVRMQFSEEYQRLLVTAAQTGRPIELLYQEMLGVPLSELGGAVLRKMALPDAIRLPIETLHSAGGRKSTNPLVRILWIAENYANASMLACSAASEIVPLMGSYCRSAVGDQNPVLPDALTLRSEVSALTVMLARLSRAEEQKLSAPLFEKRSSRVWLARERGISKSDPIEVAISSMATVRAWDRLPVDREFADIDALIVVAGSLETKGFSMPELELALLKLRAANVTLPVLVITANTDVASKPPFQCQHSVSLAALSNFVTSADNRCLSAA